MNRTLRICALSATAIGGALVSGPAFTQAGGPVARYTMDAGTIGGLGAMGRGGGMGAAMAMMRGGGGAQHELLLRLGTTRTPTGEARAQHQLPPNARFGPVLTLNTPTPGKGEVREEMPQMPKLRMLLFWGCGERAPAGQPLVIDFSKLARGQVPPGLFAQAVAIAEEWRVTQSNSRSYGEWPNTRDAKPISANASLLGAHKVTGSYTPDISFTLDQDFMAPLTLRSRDIPGGGFALSWNAVPAATGYFISTMSAKDMGRDGSATEMVWWSSASTKQFGGPLAEWLSPAAVSKLVAAKTVMPASQTSCTVPLEVRKAGGEVTMAQMYGYGPERHFAYPPRPANAKLPWKPEWIARARFRTSTMSLLGMDMGGMGMNGGDASGYEDEDGTEGSRQPTKPKCGRGLGAMAKRAAGLCE